MLIQQIWTLTKKDLLLVARRNWLSTILRAFILPVVVVLIVSYVRIWTETPGFYGIGQPSLVMPLPDALRIGKDRSRFVIIDHGLTGNDVQEVIHQLSAQVRSAGKQLITLQDPGDLFATCPMSHRGTTDCFAAIGFHSSPDQGPNSGGWKYTLHYDDIIGSTFDVRTSNNPAQIYVLPVQRAIDSMIASSHGGSGLPEKVYQYGFTYYTETTKDKNDEERFGGYIVHTFLALAFLMGLLGITYHLTGHVTSQREQGLLQLIDAMMPNVRRWEPQIARIVSTHLALDIIYLPGWIVMGAITGLIAFPTVGLWYVLASVLTGMALCSYSVLASSFFKREQLGAIAACLVALAFALMSQFAVHVGGSNLKESSVWLLSVLSPASAYIHLTLVWAKSEDDFSVSSTASRSGSSMTGATFFGILVFQIVLFPILGAFIERYLHDCSSGSHCSPPKNHMNGDAVHIIGLHKDYYATSCFKRTKSTAVEGLNLNLHAGSITTLLGANGSGKSTVLNAVAGVESMTHGTIEVDSTLGIGLCPQNNVLWNDLTVREHARLFEALKRPFLALGQRNHEVHRLIVNCDLELKHDSLAKTLSGGQRRKLQLAMALAGGSRVCCIDEASSGIDPMARRKIWDTLLSERDDRTIFLTTHFLDEVEVLSDHVALLSKGRLINEGSVASLKAGMGGGYHVMLPIGVNPPQLREIPPGIDTTKEYGATVFDVPDAASLTILLDVLDRCRVSGYQIRGPSMEEVFIRVSEEMNAKEQELQGFSSQEESDTFHGTSESSSYNTDTSTLKFNGGGECSFVAHATNLFLKRTTALKHNYTPYLLALALPLVTIGLATRFLAADGWIYGLPCPSNPNGSRGLGSVDLSIIVPWGLFGPGKRQLKDRMKRLIPDEGSYSSYYGAWTETLQWNTSTFVDTEYAFHEEIRSGLSDGYYWAEGGFFLGEQPVFAYSGLDSMTSAAMQGGLNMLLSNQSWETFLETFERPRGSGDLWESLTAVLTTLGLSVYPGLFALYPTTERLHEIRTMQYSNGITPPSLWSAYAIFDFIFILIVCILALVIWTTQYAGWYAIGYLFLVTLLYSVAATIYSYLVSLYAKSQVAALACTSLVQTLLAMLFFVGYIVTINQGPATAIEAWFDYIYYATAAVCPAVSLFRALLVSLNVYALACDRYKRAPYAAAFSRYGGPVLYLILQIIAFSALLMFLETGYKVRIPWMRRDLGDSIIEEMWSDDDDSVAAEDDGHLAASNDGVRVHNLTKSFGPVHAVENLSLGVLPSEKVALLGPNGAGKTSTISLIRGELQPDLTDPPADIYISNESLIEAPKTAKAHLGVCLQEDAIDTLTLSEHLHFYARARGVQDRHATVNRLITALGLTTEAKKLGSKLSGGTKRKLLLAIALISNPSVLLLDEPSRGMDAASKRAFWNMLSTVSDGRSMLLTTHSMEEAATLCDRAAIMSGRLLALGTISDLCARHGDRLHVHIVHEAAPHTTQADVDIIWRWAKSTFAVSEADQRTYGGQLRFNVLRQSQTHMKGHMTGGKEMGHLFRAIEANKAALGIRDYSISPTTLDQVFLNVVSKHGVIEENTLPLKKRKWATPRLFRRKHIV